MEGKWPNLFSARVTFLSSKMPLFLSFFDLPRFVEEHQPRYFRRKNTTFLIYTFHLLKLTDVAACKFHRV